MTILQATGHLYQWFSENDSFSLEKDFIKIITITEEPNRDRAAFSCALKKLEKVEMIKGDFSSSDHLQYWVLNKNFTAYEQSVSVSPDLALTISDIINDFCEKTGAEEEMCDPSEIQERDIKNLIYIANILVSDKKNTQENPTNE